MSKFINNTATNMESIELKFLQVNLIQDNNLIIPECLHYLNEKNFGILNIKMKNYEEGIIHEEEIFPVGIKKLHVYFTIDGSGSMSDLCIDNRTKMDHILFTLENMVRIFHEKEEIQISIHIQSFDSEVKDIVTNVQNIRNENIEELVKKIRTIRPSGPTNIGLALKAISENIKKSMDPETEYVHIFLTDGEITDGTKEIEELKSMVPKDITNIFIGYGKEHDSYVLSNLAKGKKNEYRFIDALEKAGLIYGEIIHSLFYRALEDVSLNCTNCEIYDFETNEWSTWVEIGNLLYEQNKTFHIRSNNPENVKIEIISNSGINENMINENMINENIIKIENSILSNNDNDIIKYLFRQKTQELLFEARKISEENNLSIYQYFHEDLSNMKMKLKKFLNSLIEYINKNDLQDDAFLKMLCDDIYIVNKTLGTRHGNMFSCARQTSQGRQQSYTCSEISEENDNPLGKLQLKRSTHVNFQQDDYNDYKLSQDILSPYSTNSQINMMRSVSGKDRIGIRNFNDNDNNDDDDNFSNNL